MWQTWQDYYLRVKFGGTLFQTKLWSRLSHKVCRLLSSPVLSCKFPIVSARLSSPQRLLWVGRWERGEVFVFPRAAYFAFPQPLPPNLVPRFSLPVRENPGNEVASPRVGRGGRLWRPLRRSVGMCLLQYKLRQIALLLKSSFYFQWKKKTKHWFNINLIINTFVSPSDIWLNMSLNTLVLIKVFVHKKSTFSRIDKFLSFLSANLKCLFFCCFIFSVKVLKKRTSSTTIIQGKLPRNLTWVYFQK